jgi:subtilisin family serine protease
MRAAARAVACLAAVTAAAMWAPDPAHAAPSSPAPATASATGSARTVTLITGDRLLVSPDGRAASRLPSPGRDAVPLLSQFAGGHLEVVPADAVALLGADRLDHRLFDVTELLADRDDDVLPLIITHDQGDPAPVVRAAAGGADVRDLDTINGLSVRVPAARTATMWRSLTGGALSTAFRKVWLDGLARPSIDVSVPLVGAPAAWAAGYTGAGVPVGVLDTGVDASHPDLAQAVAESADFTGGGDDADRAGHGTHVASIIAGSGAASGGRFRGMAPDVRVYSGKVCRADGCPESAILAGMQWAARDQGLRVVNLSLDRPDESGTDLLEQAVDTLSARYGTLFVVAAGNDGRVASPASADAALAVGATTKDDTPAAFSGRGPRTGDDALKPDIAAPGADIVAARSSASSLPRTGPGGEYTRLSGTSLAAPHVAGAAALLAQQHPDWTAVDLKAALMNTATPLPGAGVDRVGAGRLDVAQAVAAQVLAEPASLSFGSASAAATVTYRNASDTPVTLDLGVGSGGGVRLDAERLTVAPHGAASVVVRADPGPRRLAAVLTATAGDLSIRTPVAVDARSQKVRLTVRYTDRAGAPATQAFGGIYAADGSLWSRLNDHGGVGSVELPPGTYTLDAKVLGDGVTVLGQPRLVLDRDTTVDVDARLGRPVRVASPRAGSAQVYAYVGVTSGAVTANVQATTFDGLYTAQIGGAGEVPGFRTDVAGSWANPGANSPYLYSLAWSEPGRFVTGFARAVPAQDLATVRAEYARDAATGTMTLPFAGGQWGYASTLDLPRQRAEYFTAGTWSGRFDSAQGPPTVYAPGRGYDVTWNRGVFGPAFPAGYAATRSGNTLRVDPAWFSDSAGDHGDTSPAATHHLTVLRDGAPVDAGAVPAGAAEFTVTDESTRSATYSTTSRTTWTFRSAKTTRTTPLPLSTVRFVPTGDVLSFTVSRQPGSAAGPVAGFALQVSYDDGKTWRAALASRIGDRGIALLRSPPAGGFVSLKASATDAAGNRVDQTIIRAYR